ncbi:hypothetical protein OQA88_13410 [Cercophora sp. LCS_1]
MFDLIIVGAGVAGAAAATAFSRQGRQVLLIERTLKEPDRIVGELLQPGGVDALQALGLGHCLQGIDAIPIEGYHLYWKDEEASFWFCEQNGKKPEGRSFHHGRFVAKLRAAAKAEPNVTVLEATVLEILRDAKSGNVVGVACSTDEEDHARYFAPLTILADGSSSNFRSQFTPHKPKAVSRFWGLEMLDAPLPIPRYAHSVLGRGPPVLMYPIGTRETRILVDIPNSIHDRLGNSNAVRSYLLECVAPTVPKSVRPKFEHAIWKGRLRNLPNSWAPSTRNKTAGLILLGDALNMRHPVTGAGMTVALKDVVLLSRVLNTIDVPSFEDTKEVLLKMRAFHLRRKGHSASLNMLAQALYFLFASKGMFPNRTSVDIMQFGFIRYVQEGESRFAVPAWIMGGVETNVLLLFYHFFHVAVFSIGLHFRQSGPWDFLGALIRSLGVLATAIHIIWGPLVGELQP